MSVKQYAETDTGGTDSGAKHPDVETLSARTN
jgi:hypothetical protein